MEAVTSAEPIEGKKFHGFGDRIEHYTLSTARVGFQTVVNAMFSMANALRSRGNIPEVTNPLLVDSAMTLAEKIRKREVTSEEVVTAYLNRMEQINELLRCALDIRRDAAIEDARKTDQLIASGQMGDEETIKVEMPFLGVPFTVKGPIELAGCNWSAGMHHFKHRKGEENGPAVEAMVNAGAIPIAVTNVPEFCVGWESYNKILGATRNPHDLRRSAGGSSGGEGCAIAACASPFGIGTDMAGSIRIPALFNGICGHKTSPGLIPVDRGFAPPLPPALTNYLTAGPMARHAEDLLPMLKAMAKGSALEEVLEDQVELKTTRIFFMESIGDPLCSTIDKVMAEGLQKAIDCLVSIGCDVQEVELKNSRLAYRMLGHVLTKAAVGEASTTSLKDFLNGGQPEASLGREWAKFLCGKSKHTYSYLLFATCQEITAKKLQKPEGKLLDAKYEETRGHVKELLGDDGVLILPTLPHTAVYHNQTHFLACNLGHTGLVNILQLPATHVPVGFADNGLPVGVTIVANQNRDVLALTVASELQKALGGFIPGKFIKLP